MNRSWRQALVVAVATPLVLALAGCAEDSRPDTPPMGAECRALVKQQSPDLEARASELLNESRNLLIAYADCDSGDYPRVWEGIQTSRPIIQRMQTLGTAEEVRNTECLKNLSPPDCPRVWRYTPQGSEQTFRVLLPRSGSGEFAISVYRSP